MTDNRSDEARGEGSPRDTWDTFRSWHSQESLYREVYTQAVATVAAALVIYLGAAVVGLVDRTPAAFAAATVGVVGLVMIGFSLPGVIRHWSLVRPLFIVWNDDGSAEMRHAKRLYNRLIWGEILLVMPGLLLVALLVGK